MYYFSFETVDTQVAVQAPSVQPSLLTPIVYTCSAAAVVLPCACMRSWLVPLQSTGIATAVENNVDSGAPLLFAVCWYTEQYIVPGNIYE